MGRAWGRLQDRSDFLRAASKGVRKGTPAFLLQAARALSSESIASDSTASERSSAESVSLRVGFTATRKLGNAVIRNRAKRRLRAAADVALTTLPAISVDLVLIARPDVLSRTFSHMTDDLRKAAEQMIRQLDRPRTVKETS